MKQTEALSVAVHLLQGLNCPQQIMDALFVFGLTVHDDDAKLERWRSCCEGRLIQGEVVDDKEASHD